MRATPRAASASSRTPDGRAGRPWSTCTSTFWPAAHWVLPGRLGIGKDARIDRPGGRLSFAQSGLGRPVSFEKKARSEEHTSELQSRGHLVCRLLLEKK